MDNTETDELDGIAIIGMAGRFPGAENVNDFWQNVVAGHVAVTDLTDEQLNHAGISPSVYGKDNYIRKAYVLEHFDRFDAEFFDMTPKEAQTTDPQHRLLLETSYEALEDAGYDPRRYDGRIGSFVGVGKPIYTLRNILSEPGIIESIGALEFSIRTDKSFCASKVAYKLGLTGPSVTVDTACSTGLVAIHQACQSLLNYECDMAIAGGVAMSLPMTEGYAWHDGGIMAKNGHCSPFDHQSSGTTNGSGSALVTLKRLEDAVAEGDNIIAVIKGSAINNDGNRKIGYTAPSYEGQVEVISDALSIADIEPDTVELVEAHGTGTNMGDPLEVQALCEAYQMDENGQAELILTAVKSNIGHLDIAAGSAGLIKAAKALHSQIKPATANFTQLNNKIDSKHGRVKVLAESQPWEEREHPRRAGVSSFGIGGTNAHVVLEEPPVMATAESLDYSLLLCSGRNNRAAEKTVTRLTQHLHEHPTNLADAAFTTQLGRQHFVQRRALVAAKGSDGALGHVIGVKSYDATTPAERVVFMFPGQGAQYAGMAKQLYHQQPLFKETLDNCCEMLQQHLARDLKEVIWADDDELVGQTQYTQPSLFVLEYSMAKLLQSYGVEPDVMIGHSIGEYVAATLAGVMSLEDALFVVSRRASLMSQVERGTMMIVPMAADEVRALVESLDLSRTSVAVENAPELCVVAGDDGEVEKVREALGGKVDCHVLHTSHAFHSPMMEPALADFYQVMARVVLNAPDKPFVSNLTGELIEDQQATDPQYWVNHLRNTVKFSTGIGLLDEHDNTLFVEVGPGSVLSTLIKQQGFNNTYHVATCGRHHKDTQHDLAVFLTALGEIWGHGIEVDWVALNQDQGRRRVQLPTYPFERKRHWLNAPGESLPEVEEQDDEAFDMANETPIIEPANWIETDIHGVWVELLGIEKISTDACFFSLGGHSLLASRIVVRLSEQMDVQLGIADLFESPTIAGLAERVSLLTIEDSDDDELEALLNEMEGEL